MKTLESYRGRNFIDVEELAAVASSLVERYSPEPMRGNVRLKISPRIVRHYLSEDLLGNPAGQAGTSTVFDYANLLRLLAVKKLLAEHWSVIKIKEIIGALDFRSLEKFVSGALAKIYESDRDVDEARRDFQKRTGTNNRRSPDSVKAPATRYAPEVYTSSLTALAASPTRRTSHVLTEWIEIATGLEIKVRRSFRPPRTEQERQRLTARFWSVVKSKE